MRCRLSRARRAQAARTRLLAPRAFRWRSVLTRPVILLLGSLVVACPLTAQNLRTTSSLPSRSPASFTRGHIYDTPSFTRGHIYDAPSFTRGHVYDFTRGHIYEGESNLVSVTIQDGDLHLRLLPGTQ